MSAEIVTPTLLDKVPGSSSEHTEREWQFANKRNYEISDRNSAFAEKLALECKRTCGEVEEIGTQDDLDTSRHFSLRLKDVDYMRKEGERAVDSLKDDIDRLQEYGDRLNLAINELVKPMSIYRDCLNYRKQREGIDLMYDEVQKNLEQQILLISKIEDLYKVTMNDVSEQLRAARSAKYQLEKDIMDNYKTVDIDTAAASLNTVSESVNRASDSRHPSTRSVTVEEWEDYYMDHIRDGQVVHARCKRLYPSVETVLQNATNDMEKQHTHIVASLKDRVLATEVAKERLEQRAAEVRERMDEIDVIMQELHHKIEEKEAHLRLARTRLQARNERPNMQLCRDGVELQLEKEEADLTKSIQTLCEKLEDAKDTRRVLMRTSIALQEEAGIKTKTLHIDSVQCLGALAGIVFGNPGRKGSKSINSAT